MADRTTPLILDALRRAVADPAGMPLHGGKGERGLFAATAAAKHAAQRSKEEGLLCVVRSETHGKGAFEICAPTEKGLAYLLRETSAKQVLEDMVRALEARQNQAGELLLAARQMQASFDALKAAAEKVLEQVRKPPPLATATNGSDTWVGAVFSYLQRRQAADDCPLPELYRHALQAAPALTIGHFHDSIRRLHAQEQVHLHPWTGPLYELPEPTLALLVGHEVAYYVGLRG